VAARIASDPIKTAAPPTSELRARAAFAGLQPLGATAITPQATAASSPQPLAPAPEPGVAFMAAVLAGDLPPKPETPKELMMRLGRSWAPPASELHLTDKKI
jgi:hypothetical protein